MIYWFLFKQQNRYLTLFTILQFFMAVVIAATARAGIVDSLVLLCGLGLMTLSVFMVMVIFIKEFGVKGKRYMGTTMVLIGFLILVAALHYQSGQMGSLVEQTDDQMMLVARHLQSYKQVHQRYPISLADLRQAGYAVPVPARRQGPGWQRGDFGYSLTDDEQGFELSYQLSDRKCFYDAKSVSTECDY